jgi:hypothetical protein
MEKGEYVLFGALAVQDDLDAEQIDRVSRHLGGFATVHLAHDDIAHSVAIRISGVMSLDDTRIIEKRIEKFAEEYCSAGAKHVASKRAHSNLTTMHKHSHHSMRLIVHYLRRFPCVLPFPLMTI